MRRCNEFLFALLFFCAASGGPVFSQEQDRVRVACVGDSITEGNANPEHLQNSWPMILGRLLEQDQPGRFEVQNFGSSGATMLRKGWKPYWNLDHYRRSLASRAHIVVINLGTNDAAPVNWDKHGAEFENDYRDLVTSYRALDPSPRIFLSNLTPVFEPSPRVKDVSTSRAAVEKTIKKLAGEFKLPIIDLKTPLAGKAKLFPDGLHPNTAGNEYMARAVFQAITQAPAPRDQTIRPRPVAGKDVALVKKGAPQRDLREGRWRRTAAGHLTGQGPGNLLLSGVTIEAGDFYMRTRLRMQKQKNSAAAFFVDDNYFGFEGAVGRTFRNGPRMGGGLRLLHPAELLWERDSWIDFEVIRNKGMVWFIVNGFTVEMAQIPGSIKRIGFDPMRSTMQITDWRIVGTTKSNRPAHLDRRTVDVPWIDLRHLGRSSLVAPLGVDESVLVPEREITATSGGGKIWLGHDAEGRVTARLKVDGDGVPSDPVTLPRVLQGEGHAATYLPDGRLIITYRDLCEESATSGDIVGWVGTFDDLVSQREGQFTVRLVEVTGKPVHLACGPVNLTGGRLSLTYSRQQSTSSERGLYVLNVPLKAVLERVPERRVRVPLIDLDADEGRHVVVDREDGQYLGHVSTELLADGKTILAVYPKGHGKGPIVYKRSEDGGRTWSERLKTPDNWATSKEVPTIHRMIDPRSKEERLVLWSGLYPARRAVSDDNGKTWSPLEVVGDWGGIVVMGFVERLKDGRYVAMFHDDGRFISNKNRRRNPPVFSLYQVFSDDGGLSWSQPEIVWRGSEIHLCEPGCIRSPDGTTLAVLLRENSRRRNSYVIFSHDEAETWSAPRELPASLTGDRHTLCYAPDGRLFICFRDTALESATQGDWAGWVGTWEDLETGGRGQYRVRFKDNKHRWDTTYPGVELLPDGTFVVTTYGHWEKGKQPYILSARFTLAELDKRLSRPGK